MPIFPGRRSVDGRSPSEARLCAAPSERVQSSCTSCAACIGRRAKRSLQKPTQDPFASTGRFRHELRRSLTPLSARVALNNDRPGFRLHENETATPISFTVPLQSAGRASKRRRSSRRGRVSGAGVAAGDDGSGADDDHRHRRSLDGSTALPLPGGVSRLTSVRARVPKPASTVRKSRLFLTDH